MKRVKIAILDVSDHIRLFEDDLFKTYMFTQDIAECTTYHVARNNWPSLKDQVVDSSSSQQIVNFLIDNFDGVLIPGSEDCCMDDSLCYIGTLCEVIRGLIALNFPLFGVCFGAQAICRAISSSGVDKLKNLNEKPEFGIVLIDFVNEIVKKNPLLKGIDGPFYSSSSHSDCFLLNLLDENTQQLFEHLLQSKHWKNQGYQVKGKLTYGLQFHPEMDSTVSEEIFKSMHVPIIYDNNVKQPDMAIGKVMARNFCEMILHQQQQLDKKV